MLLLKAYIFHNDIGIGHHSKQKNIYDSSQCGTSRIDNFLAASITRTVELPFSASWLLVGKIHPDESHKSDISQVCIG